MHESELTERMWKEHGHLAEATTELDKLLNRLRYKKDHSDFDIDALVAQYDSAHAQVLVRTQSMDRWFRLIIARRRESSENP